MRAAFVERSVAHGGDGEDQGCGGLFGGSDKATRGIVSIAVAIREHAGGCA